MNYDEAQRAERISEVGIPNKIEDQSEDSMHERIVKDHQEKQTWAYYDRIKRREQ